LSSDCRVTYFGEQGETPGADTATVAIIGNRDVRKVTDHT